MKPKISDNNYYPSDLAKMFNVSEQTIKKWVLVNNLDYKIVGPKAKYLRFSNKTVEQIKDMLVVKYNLK